MFKTCTKCGAAKALGCFSAQAGGLWGVTSICKPCSSERGKAWHRANREVSLVTKRAYRAKHAEKFRETSAAWRAANPEREKIRAAKWSAENKDKKAAATARRRAALLRATPAWASASDIQAFYTLAGNLTRETGTWAHVDHIVPLQSSLVCGLHCAANLTISTARLNKKKGNLWWPDMPVSENNIVLSEESCVALTD